MTGAGRKILVVDDEAMLRRVFQRWLAAAGYEVLEATDGEHALEQLASYGKSISAVLTDLRMPGMSGEQLIAHLAERWPELPVIGMSGSERRPAGLSRDRFLEKPVSRDDVLRMVAVVVGPSPAD